MPIKIFVASGSSCPCSAKTSMNVGMTFIMMMATTTTAIISTNIG